MKDFKIRLIIIFFFAFSGIGLKAQNTAPDGEFISITKTYTLNTAGDWSFRYQHSLKFLTYYAINNLYGETFIVYNSGSQKLKINKAFTTMADGTKVIASANAFNEVLPRYAANFPTGNMLREMVITHTGLERGAIVDLDYEIQTAAGFSPAMTGNELLQTSSPVDDLTVVVKIPEGTPLQFKLLAIQNEPLVSHEKGFQVYTFSFKNLAALTHDDFQARDQRFIPRLLFNTGKGLSDQLSMMLNQPAFKYACEGHLKITCDSLVKNYPDNFLRIMRIQEIVANEMNYSPIPPQVMGFKFRTATETWNSNCGTETEKAILLATMLRACGFEACALAVIPETYYPPLTSNLLTIEKVLVKVSARGHDDMYISPLQTDLQNLKFSLGENKLITLIPKKTTPEAELTFPENELLLNGELAMDIHGRISGNISFKTIGATNPAFKLKRDKKYFNRMLFGAYSSADIKTSKINAAGSESTEAVFDIASSDTLKQEANYFFWKVPALASGTDGWHMAELSSARNTPLEIPVLIMESYSYKVKLPEGIRLVTPSTDLLINPDRVGEIKIQIKQEGQELLVTRSLKLNEPIIEPEDYTSFRNLMNIWNEKKYREIILKK